jgi:ABC-2 type transport system ATP-binding protein
VFFSSHILADAEALCNRVAVVARGRLAASGRLSDMLHFEVRGWELVMAGVTAAARDRVAPIARSLTEISAGRYAIELPADRPPDQVLVDLTATGATLVSLNPVRETLEDFFVERVASMTADSADSATAGRTL